MTYSSRFMGRCISISLIAIVLAVSVAGCDTDEPSRPPASPTAQPSPWRSSDDTWQIALTEESTTEALAEAVSHAQATLADAREQWLVASEADRDHWAVQWAAPAETDDGQPTLEHVWVKPLHWSMFRMEGRLLSQPTRSLFAHRSQGDLVSFPLDEVTDWVYFPDGDRAGRREGGFTIDALESRYGRPPASNSNEKP